MPSLRAVGSAVLGRLFPSWGYGRLRRWWEARWSEADYGPPWHSSVVPRELRQAVEDGWFPAGGKVLDIGCGSGEIAHWLSDQGFQVTGVDYSQAAVLRARARGGTSGNGPRFETVDMCRQRLPEAQFDALFDRGCFHTIPDQFKSAYAANVGWCARPGARFLLIHWAFGPNMPHRDAAARGVRIVGQEQVMGQVQRCFGELFEISAVEQTSIDVMEGAAPRLGLAFWMVRSKSKA